MKKNYVNRSIKNVFVTALTILFFCIATTIATVTTFASTGSTESDPIVSAGFTYTLEFPENQFNESLGYYQLLMNPGQKQELTIILSNPGTESITIELALNGAKTNKNGVIEYANNEIDNDPSLAFAFEELVTGPESVELAAGETKSVKLAITMPETSFEGVIAGGLQLMKAGQTDDVGSESGGSTVLNQYAYVVSILLQESEDILTPDLQFNKAYAGQLNYRNSVYVNFSNVIATYLNDLTVEAQVMKKGSNTVLYETKKTSMRMAPSSFMDFPISMNGEQMKAGTYTVHALATAGDQRWEWKEDFEITEDEAQKYNERDVGLTQETGLHWGLIIGIVGGVISLIILVSIVLIVLRRKRSIQKVGRKKSTSPKKKNEHIKKKRL
ncbi:WxL protein host-binding domain-containing protein [Enterococcus sp. 5H]|uniref:WxL protein host-binding domain-containing protein n=1 Tax=Enterococcus sp. 5H TaxID=1229490 RepID=UPI002303EF9B|nr:DUF3324 domain-containing protein [Enterococcus sp. 5H]MDA9472548.1 putative cell wall surface anchor family protein [Enterococcus sp. 5H]